MYYGGRFYDPLVGQFTRPDPLSVDGPNRFAYVRNNPVIGTDPSGLCTMISGELTCGSNSKVYGGFRGGRDDSSTGRYENYTQSKSRDKVPTATAAYVPASPVVVDRAVTAAVVELGVGVVVGVGCVYGSALTGFTAAFGCGAVGASAGGAAGNLVAGRDVTDGVVQDAVVGGVGGGLGYVGGRLASSVVDDVADTIFTQYRPPAPNSTAGSIRNVNPTGSGTNCVNCVVATDATLAGPQPISILQDVFGGTFKPVSGQGEITALMTDAGSGARGVVFGSRGSDVGHVFNAVNQGGTVRFLDGQTGAAASFTGFDGFRFMLIPG